MPTPTNAKNTGNLSLTPINNKNHQNNSINNNNTNNNNNNNSNNNSNNNNNNNNVNNPQQTFYSYMPIPSTSSTSSINDSLSLSSANTPSHSSSSSPFTSFNLATALANQATLNNFNNTSVSGNGGNGNNVLQSPTPPMLGNLMTDMSNFTVRMPTAYPAVNNGSNSNLSSLFLPSSSSLMNLTANNFANLSALAGNNSNDRNNQHLPVIAAPIAHHPNDNNHTFNAHGLNDSSGLVSLGMALNNNNNNNNLNNSLNRSLNNNNNNNNNNMNNNSSNNFNPVKSDNKRKSQTAESTASLRRKKHKEVEIRRRKKINTLFSDLSGELECGPTDKASILLFALNFIKGIKKKYGNLDLKSLSGSGGTTIIADNIKTENDEEIQQIIAGTSDSDDNDTRDQIDNQTAKRKRQKTATSAPPPLNIQSNNNNNINNNINNNNNNNNNTGGSSQVSSTLTSPTIHRPTFADINAIMSIPPSPAAAFSSLNGNISTLNQLLSQTHPSISAFYNPNNPISTMPTANITAPIIPTPILPQSINIINNSSNNNNNLLSQPQQLSST